MKLNKFKRKSLSINITSLIDVMFILLLFFIVTSTFRDINAAALDLELPKSDEATEEQNDIKEFTLYLDKHNNVSIAGRVFQLDSLQYLFSDVKDEIAGNPIVIKGDQEVTYQSFIKVFDVLKSHDITNLILAAEKE